VTDSGSFLIIPAHSSARGPRDPCFRHQTFTRTYTDCGLGLKILVSAVQSRPSPPFISHTSPSRNVCCSEFVTEFVTNSGTLQRIPAHEVVSEYVGLAQVASGSNEPCSRGRSREVTIYWAGHSRKHRSRQWARERFSRACLTTSSRRQFRDVVADICTPALGAGSRRFKSSHPDHSYNARDVTVVRVLCGLV
jgi:hypothetical protein